MKTITLQILAEDIINSEYAYPGDCAITRALKRAGINAHEGGGEIFLNEFGGYVTTPEELQKKVMGMYAFIDRSEYSSAEKKAFMWCNSPEIEPQDFEYQLELPDNW